MISVLCQHGRGTHIWILSQGGGLQCFLSNQYTGDFVQGQRHGRGTFYYASGAIYEGEWSNNASLAKVHQSIMHHCHTARTHALKFVKILSGNYQKLLAWK